MSTRSRWLAARPCTAEKGGVFLDGGIGEARTHPGSGVIAHCEDETCLHEGGSARVDGVARRALPACASRDGAAAPTDAVGMLHRSRINQRAHQHARGRAHRRAVPGGACGGRQQGRRRDDATSAALRKMSEPRGWKRSAVRARPATTASAAPRLRRKVGPTVPSAKTALPSRGAHSAGTRPTRDRSGRARGSLHSSGSRTPLRSAGISTGKPRKTQ